MISSNHFLNIRHLKRGGRYLYYKKSDNVLGISLLLPALIVLICLIAYPLIFAVKLGFNSQMIYELQGRFIGLRNYINTFTDPDFWNSARLSIIWVVVTVGGQMVLGIITALLLNEEFKGRGLARAFILLPFFMPGVSVTLMWRWLLNENYGLINAVLQGWGIIHQPISWLGSANGALAAILFIGIWKYFSFVTINVLAGLQTIPLELYESARVDGANLWAQFRYITLPEIKNVISVVLLLRIIFMFKKFDEIWMLTGGGPGISTSTLPLYAYKYAFTGMQLGRGSAISIIISVMVCCVIFIYLKSTKMNQQEAGL
jgi:multiple sugar transport system permease protein